MNDLNARKKEFYRAYDDAALRILLDRYADREGETLRLELRALPPEENAATIRGVFDGTIRDARRDAVLLNAAGALIIGDKADGFADGITRVAEIIDSGQASAKLASLVEKSNAYLK